MNILVKFAGPTFVYACIIRLFCIAIFLTALEYLTIIRQFGDGGIYSWKIIKLRIYPPILKLRPDFLFNKSGVLGILLVRMLCSVYLFISPVSQVTVFILVLIVITSLLLAIRNIIGNDGSDQMSVILSISLFISFFFHTPEIAVVSLYFIAAQSVLSYLIAGGAKMLSKKWRSGEAIFQIMNTESYGSERIALYLQHSSPVVGAIMAWGVMLFETLFFMVIILPYPYFFIFLIWGFCFHIYNAVIMGLNNFFWVFLATYPAVIYTNIAFHHYWG